MASFKPFDPSKDCRSDLWGTEWLWMSRISLSFGQTLSPVNSVHWCGFCAPESNNFRCRYFRTDNPPVSLLFQVKWLQISCVQFLPSSALRYPLDTFPIVNDSANMDPWTHGQLMHATCWMCYSHSSSLTQHVWLLDTFMFKAATSNCCTKLSFETTWRSGVLLSGSVVDGPGFALQHQKQNKSKNKTLSHSHASLNDKQSWFYHCRSIGVYLTRAKVALMSLGGTNHIQIFHWPKCCYAWLVHSMSPSESAGPQV